MTQLYQEKKTM